MSEPIVVVAVFTAVAGRKGELREALTAAIPAVHGEAGCELYAIHDAPEDEIWMIEKWSSETELDAHGGGEPVARLGRLIDGLVAGPPRVVRMWPIPTGTPGQGLL